MFQRRFSVALAILGGAALTWLPASASAEEAQASKPLAAEQFAALHRMLLPKDGELQWMALPWRTSITLARHQAAAADKPLLIFADTGAGFADALGLC